MGLRQSLSAEHDVGTGETFQLLHVLEHVFCGPGEDRSYRQVAEFPARSELLHLLEELSAFGPVGVREQDALGRALLAGAGIGVLVALPRHVLLRGGVVGGGVGAEQLPIESSIFKEEPSMRLLGQQLRDALAAGEKGIAGLGLPDHVTHGGTGAVEQIQIGGGHAAVEQEANQLLENNAHAGIHMDQRLVAHEEGAHGLERGDFEGEVEGGDQGDWAIGPPVARGHLAGVVSGIRKSTGQKTDLVPRKVLEEGPSDGDLAGRLLVALGGHALDQAGEEVGHFGTAELLGHALGHAAVHHVPLGAFKRVVKTRFSDRF
mmetsp:Transcript_19120/g.34595  ORF Transcript_19120/g.34595 Transcript_19120/m.34595 type:complete len:318 (-) Transcript_19120:388-1341(-)